MNAVDHQTLENLQQNVKDTVFAIASNVCKEVLGPVDPKALDRLRSNILIKAGNLFQQYSEENAETFIGGVQAETIWSKYLILFSFHCNVYK